MTGRRCASACGHDLGVSEIRAEEGLQAEAREDEEVPRRLGIGALAHDAAIYGASASSSSRSPSCSSRCTRHLSPAEFGTLSSILAFAAFVDVFINLSGVLACFYFDQDDLAQAGDHAFFLIESIYPGPDRGPPLRKPPRRPRGRRRGLRQPDRDRALVDLYLTNMQDISMSLTRMRRKLWTFALYALIRGLTYVTLAVLLVAVWELGVKHPDRPLTSAIIVFVVSAREYVRDLIRGVDQRRQGDDRLRLAHDRQRVLLHALNLLDRFFVSTTTAPRRPGCTESPSAAKPDRARRGIRRLRMGVAAVALTLAQQRPPPADGGPWRELVLRGTRLSGRARLRMDPPALPPADARALLGGDRGGPAALDRRDGDGSVRRHGGRAERDEADAPDHPYRPRRGDRRGRALLPPHPAVRLRRRGVGATAGGLWLLPIFVGIVSHRIYPVPWEWRRVGLAVGVTPALALASLAVDAQVPFDASLPVRVAITLAYPAALARRSWTAAERRRLTGRPRRR